MFQLTWVTWNRDHHHRVVNKQQAYQFEDMFSLCNTVCWLCNRYCVWEFNLKCFHLGCCVIHPWCFELLIKYFIDTNVYSLFSFVTFTFADLVRLELASFADLLSNSTGRSEAVVVSLIKFIISPLGRNSFCRSCRVGQSKIK